MLPLTIDNSYPVSIGTLVEPAALSLGCSWHTRLRKCGAGLRLYRAIRQTRKLVDSPEIRQPGERNFPDAFIRVSAGFGERRAARLQASEVFPGERELVREPDQ